MKITSVSFFIQTIKKISARWFIATDIKKMPDIKTDRIALEDRRASTFFFSFFLHEYRFYCSAWKINAACFTLDHFFSLRRDICHLKCVDFDHRSEKQEEHRVERRARGNGCWRIRECIVPSFFTVENKLPAARAGRVVYIFLLSLSLSFSVSLRKRPRLYIWRLKRLYYCRASPVDRKSRHNDLRRDCSNRFKNNNARCLR